MRSRSKFILKSFLASLPAVLSFSGWKLAVWAYDYFACQGGVKNMQSCFAGGVDILPALGIGLFWCPILLWICLPVSAWLLIRVWAQHIAAHPEQANS